MEDADHDNNMKTSEEQLQEEGKQAAQGTRKTQVQEEGLEKKSQKNFLNNNKLLKIYFNFYI